MKNLSTFLAIFFPLFLFSQNIQAGEKDLESSVYDTTRTITVYLPEAYFTDDSTNFPVAYLFDGQFPPYLLMARGAMEYYSQTGESMAMIIVAIHSHDRREELIAMKDQTPKSITNYGAERLSDHLREEVIPFVESNYRTNTFRLGVGHSLGGSYVLNELFEENSLFNGVIAASPNLALYDEQIVSKIKSYLKHRPKTNKYVFVAVGDEGDMENRFKNSLENLDLIISEMELPNFDWNYGRLENENHMTTFLRTFDDGLNHLSDKWWISDEIIELLTEAEDLEQALKNRFADQESFTGEQMDFTFENIQKITRRLSKLEEYETAIATLAVAEKCSDADTSWIPKVRDYYKFKSITDQADLALENEEFQKASEHYLIAMDMGLIKGTHRERARAIQSFAQTGHFEEAFKQLSLLETKFGWRGRASFENNELMKPLHDDPRWEELMVEFDKN